MTVPDPDAARERALAALERARTAAEQAVTSQALTRETRMDAQRRLDVLRRQQEALVRRSQERLERPPAGCRAVLAHASPWFLDRLTAALAGDVEVVARVDNGADAIGIALAEQPDLLLVGEAVAMVPGEDVVRACRRWSPAALVAVHLSGGAPSRFTEAGADAVFTRQQSPAVVAEQLRSLLQRSSA